MLDDTANTRLLESAWQCVHAKDSTVYYVKHHLGSADYHLLVTDLKRVWYDCATADELHEKSRKHRLVIETQEQLSELVAHLGSFFQSLEKCEIRQLNSTHLQIECAELQGFARLTWTFMCKVLDGFQGATVLYDHFILPMLMVADVNQPGLKVVIYIHKIKLNQLGLVDVQPSVPLGKVSARGTNGCE